MPSFTDISSISLDKFQMQKNPTPKDNPTDNQYFVYFDFPAQGYPIQFQKMIFDSTNKPLNLLNFSVTSNNFPILYIAKNGKFQNPDLQSYIPVGIQITQKIHNTNIMATSTNDDLQMIIECNQVSGSNVCFIHILLTNDTQNKNSGDDFNKLFDNMVYIDQLETNTKNFETQNLKPPPFKYNFSSGIVNQFEKDTSISDSISSTDDNTFSKKDSSLKSMKCFYFKDSKNNMHILLQTPIPISSKNFTNIQDFYKNYGLQMNPFIIYPNSNLIPTQSVSVTLDVLLGTKESLQKAQSSPPLTADGKKEKEKEVKKTTQTKNNVDAANKAQKAGNESFISSYGTREGLTTMNCRVAQSSDKLVATLVGTENSMTTALDGYQLVIALGSIILFGVIIFFWVKKTMFLIPINTTIKSLERNFSDFRTIFQLFKDKQKHIRIIYGLLIFVAIVVFIPVTIPNVSQNAKFPCTIISLLCILSVFFIQFLIHFFNNRVTPNRYNYTYRILQEILVSIGTCKNDFKNIDKEIPNTDDPNDRNQQYFIFLNQCMSHFFGDNQWYPDRNDITDIYKIKEIGEKNQQIIVSLVGNEKKYTYDTKLTLSCATPTPMNNP